MGISFFVSAFAASAYKYRCGNCGFAISHPSYSVAVSGAKKHANATRHTVYPVGGNYDWCRLELD